MARPRNPVDTSTYSGRFAARMRALREKTGLTMEELADKTGVSVATLYSWENASRSPVNDDLLNVAKVLNVNVRNLLPKE
jgi:transcriptional regulator with XRE-family HTH domain